MADRDRDLMELGCYFEIDGSRVEPSRVRFQFANQPRDPALQISLEILDNAVLEAEREGSARLNINALRIIREALQQRIAQMMSPNPHRQ